MSQPIRVTVWNEFRHETKNQAIRQIYPDGMHAAIARGIASRGDFQVRTAVLDDPEHGLTEEVLAATDVLTWWGHLAHGEVQDTVVDRVHRHVLEGLGLVALHSAHYSKIFKRLMGTTCSLKWREAGDKERLWNLAPSHPVTQGSGDYFEIPAEEMYGERFDVPTPDALLFVSWFEGGEIFRSGCCWERGHGRIVYFRPGHETFPTYHDPNVLRVIANACAWARRRVTIPDQCPNVKELEPIKPKA
ncbi:ThuA domain-containing protein [bacterium]|nr:ThuA domain-containing protein [bacterium]